MATLIWPVSGRVSSNIGPRRGRTHKGIDIAVPQGNAVRATADGTAYALNDPDGFGLYVRVDHANGYQTYYGHLSSRTFGGSRRVRQGDTLGSSGNTGSSEGPHLHFEIRLNGTYRDWDAKYPVGTNVVVGQEIHAVNVPNFPGSAGGTNNARPTLRRGSAGPDVAHLQTLLIGHGHSLSVDSQFGPATESAVKAFQGAHGLAADGIVGPNTWNALEGSSPTGPRPVLRRGDRGAAVQELQSKLNRFGYGLAVDGDFGPATEGAVRDFQGKHGLVVDGIVGPATWGKLG